MQRTTPWKSGLFKAAYEQDPIYAALKAPLFHGRDTSGIRTRSTPSRAPDLPSSKQLILLEIRSVSPVFRDTMDVLVPTPDVNESAASRPSLALGLLTLVTIFAAFLRFHALAAKTFWFDEGVSIGIARLDWYNFGRILWRREANMSLYYLLLRGWLHFGQSEFFVRTLSVLLALATIPVIYFLGRRLFDSRSGMIAAILLAVNAYHVRYSQEARSYSLMVLLCGASSLYFLKVLELPSRRNRIAYIFLSTAAVYAHFYSVLLIFSQCLSLFLLDQKLIPKEIKNAWRWIALLISPIAIFVATTGAGPLRWIQRPGLKSLWILGLRLTGNDGTILLLVYAVACLAAVVPLLAHGQKRMRVPWATWRYRFLLLWLLFPVLSVFVLSQARPLFLPRYFILCLPALLMLAAAGISRIPNQWITAFATLIVVALSIQGTASYYRQDFEDTDREDWRAASQYILTNAHPGDAILFHIPMGRMPYEYYLSLQRPLGAPPTVLYPSHGQQLDFRDFVEKPSYDQLEGSIAKYDRIWLVLSHAGGASGLDDTALHITRSIFSGHAFVDQCDFNGLDVVLYEVRPYGKLRQ
jgi:mannosyltransferase